MAALSNEAKLYIVQAQACFDTPSTVMKAIKVDMGLTVTPQQCEIYDPTKRAGRELSKKWRTIFEETRKAFLADTSQTGISHRAVRLRALNRMMERAESSGNIPLAAQLMEQAAKEIGDMYVNRLRKADSDDDLPPASRIEVTVVDARKRDAKS